MKNKFLDWRNWVRGVIGAAIGSASNSVAAVVIAPESFNFHDGLSKLGEFAAYSAIIGAAMWLKQHPVPDETVLPASTTTTTSTPPTP